MPHEDTGRRGSSGRGSPAAALVRLIPVVLSLLLLGAHFLRAGNALALAIIALLLVLVGVRRPWAATALQIGLAAGAAEWAITVWRLASARAAAGEPAARLAAILGAVAAFTALSLLAFRSPAVQRWFRRAA